MTAPDRFDQLAASYNFRIPTDRVTLFADVVQSRIAGLPTPRRVLDIGCGHGIAQSTEAPKRLRAVADELWGIEPDDKVPQPSHTTHYQHALMETAKLPEHYFNLAYSCLVMEHVAEPAAFLKALHRTLAPGGEYVFMTMNARHYFVRIASALRATGLDEFVLRRVRKGVVEEYHYPVQYKFNHPTTIA